MGHLSHSIGPCLALLRPPAMQTNEPERPGVTPITLVVGDTTTYCLWIQQSTAPSTKLILRHDSDGNLSAAIGAEEVCNDYTEG